MPSISAAPPGHALVAIGGFIFSGLIGLFTGAIVLSAGYTLMMHWIGEEQK